MSRALSILSVLIGTLWAQALLVAGLWLVFDPVLTGERLIAGTALLAAGLLLAMWLVVDRLVPRAIAAVVIPLKLAAAATFSVCGLIAAYSLATGNAPALPTLL